MPKLSIIVPVFNVEKYIDQCVESLRNQTLKDIEIILVDDESPDNCPAICNQYAEKDERIKVIHKKNGGLGFARNSGLDVACGEFVTFVDSDDYVDTSTYQYLLNKYEAEKQDVIFYKYCRFKTGEDISAQESDVVNRFESEKVLSIMLDIIAAPVNDKNDRSMQCSSCTAIYKRDILESNGIRFHSERELISEDMVFNLDVLAVVNKGVYDHSVLYYYRKNDYSVTHTIDLHKIDRLSQFSRYISNNIGNWNLPQEEASLRWARMTIGYFRSLVSNAMMLPLTFKEKEDFFRTSLASEELQQAMDIYPWRRYTIYPKLFYLSQRYRIPILAFVLSMIKKSRS